MKEKVEEIIDLYVRPILKDHYGNIKVTKIEDNVVYVKFLGECASCASANYTVDDVVAKLIIENIPEIKNVYIDTFDEELYMVAKKILNKEISL